MLFGEEFYTDERAQVDGGLRGVESVNGDVALDEALDVHGIPEDLLVEQFKLRVETDGCQFVFVHQKLRVLTYRRPMEATG